VFDHVTIRVSERGVSEPLYDSLLGEKTLDSASYAVWNDFSLAQASAELPVTRRLHVGFAGSSSRVVQDPDGNRVAAARDSRIDHVRIGVSDVEAVARFYELLSAYTGFARAEAARFEGPRASLSLIESSSPTEHVHNAFPASENATVDAFHAAALEAGYRDNGAPGYRPIYHARYYGAFVLDPAGHNVEVVNHNR
jgi:catechol 2,3-dioxygenase-like lactoylglutathione lyase family enzyme